MAISSAMTSGWWRGTHDDGRARAQEPAVELRHALEEHRRVPVHALLDADGLHDGHVRLAQEKVGKDERMRRPLDEALPGAPGRSGVPGRAGIGPPAVRDAAEPLEGLLEAGRPVDLDVAIAPVAHHRLDAPFLADHPVILRPDRLPQGQVDEAEVIAVEVVLGQHLPVGRAAMLDPARRQLDLAFGRQVAGPVDQPRGGAEMLFERDPVGAEAGEDEAAVAGHPRGARQTVRVLSKAPS